MNEITARVYIPRETYLEFERYPEGPVKDLIRKDSNEQVAKFLFEEGYLQPGQAVYINRVPDDETPADSFERKVKIILYQVDPDLGVVTEAFIHRRFIDTFTDQNN